VRGLDRRAKFLRRGIGSTEALSCRLLKGSERKIAPMTVSSPNVIEIKLERLIDDMRLLRSQMIAFGEHDPTAGLRSAR
jgi:hypothetical protein